MSSSFCVQSSSVSRRYSSGNLMETVDWMWSWILVRVWFCVAGSSLYLFFLLLVWLWWRAVRPYPWEIWSFRVWRCQVSEDTLLIRWVLWILLCCRVCDWFLRGRVWGVGFDVLRVMCFGRRGRWVLCCGSWGRCRWSWVLLLDVDLLCCTWDIWL